MLAHFGHHLLTALPVPLLPLIREEFSLNGAQSGLVVMAFTLSYGIGQLPAGWLADRIGPRVLITIGILGVAVAGLLVGLSQTFTFMIVFLVLMGLAGGGYHPSAAPLISGSVEKKNQGLALGFHMIGGSGSFFLAPLIAAAIAAAWNWRGSFIGLAAPAAAFGIVFYILLGRRARFRKTGETTAEQPEEEPSPPGRWRRLTAFMVLSIFTQAVMFSIITFVALFMVDKFDIAEESAGAFLSITYSAGLWAGPLGGYIADRFGKMPVVLIVCLMAGPVIYLMTLAPYPFGFGAMLLLMGMIVYIRMPASEAYIISQTSAHNRSTILGIYYFATMEAGGLLSPVVGLMIDNYSYETSFTVAGASILAVTIVCSLWLWRERG